ncbi:uncharacterized protein LOC116610684 isoform X1 [Nematostella vectensis]|uniref:uncharacterized protein LOC116610684 isoform X1 n=1 Tax=Nematostella vectensis TaxID=45351 RepID=UPI0020779346|nr:uncharacterized protein LOC116610684 isoform X1 [Nematostella vectensis]
MADALKIVSEFALSVDFSTDKLGPDFMWFNPPPKWQMKFHGDSGGMKVVPRGKTDFWRRTYYKPELIKDNGHLLHLIVKQEMCIIETSFDLTAVNQFDQAGIMIRMGNERWMKIGLEFVDGTYRASCVVTNKYSDWSTQDWHDGKLALRIHKICDDYVGILNANGESRKRLKIQRSRRAMYSEMNSVFKLQSGNSKFHCLARTGTCALKTRQTLFAFLSFWGEYKNQ